MNEKTVNLPVLALMCSLEASNAIIQLLPDTDLVAELCVLFLDQLDILEKMEKKQQFHTKEIIAYCEACKDKTEIYKKIKLNTK